ncbi:MAG: flagellar motor switch phosphatase FliY [Candidatus Fimivivens sp.]
MDISAKGSDSALSAVEIDAVGEILNISMGSATTAVSTMLDKQVKITTPRVRVESLGLVEYSALEPALSIKITYTEGLSGSNVLIFRQHDIQLILNQLMSIDDPPSDDFELDELSMSAACEVMNQMMGASATALSELLGRAVHISTPEAQIITSDFTFSDAIGMDADQQIVSVHFNMDIQGVMTSELVIVMPCNLAKSMVSDFIETTQPQESAAMPTPGPTAPEVMPPQPAPPLPVTPTTAPQAFAPTPAAQPEHQPQQIPQTSGGAGPCYPSPSYYPPYPPTGVPGYPPYYSYPPYPPYLQQSGTSAPPDQSQKMDPHAMAQVQNVQLPQFSKGVIMGEPVLGGNTDLLMNVPLDVTIEIGQARRKIKDILSFAQGTVIELEKQAGAPVDIVVNGQLIAHGDVVVIDDNFGVRITEILGTRALLSSLEKEI